MHPSMSSLLEHFDRPLPERQTHLESLYRDLAREVARCKEGPEATVALRKLLESRDAMLRAHPLE